MRSMFMEVATVFLPHRTMNERAFAPRPTMRERSDRRFTVTSPMEHRDHKVTQWRALVPPLCEGENAHALVMRMRGQIIKTLQQIR